MDKIIDSVGGLLDKITFVPNNELKLALIGAILTAVLFLIALLISSGSKINALRRKLFSAITKIAPLETIDEVNAHIIHEEIVHLPEPVSKGWGLFMEQRTGYPSDYIPSRDVLIARNYSGRNTAGKSFFRILSVFLWAVLAFVTVGLCAGDLAKVGLSNFTDNFSLIAAILSIVLLPFALFVTFSVILNHHYNKQIKRLEMTFTSFQDALDEKVIVYAEPKVEFSTDNLEDMSRKVDELISGRMEDEEPVEIISVPESEIFVETDEPEPIFAEEVVEEEKPTEEPIEDVLEEVTTVVEEAPVSAIPMTREEEERYLAVLLLVVDQALTDPETKEEDLEEIAVLIETARNEGFREPADQDILEQCLVKLAQRYYN